MRGVRARVPAERGPGMAASGAGLTEDNRPVTLVQVAGVGFWMKADTTQQAAWSVFGMGVGYFLEGSVGLGGWGAGVRVQQWAEGQEERTQHALSPELGAQC